MSIIINNIAQV